MAFQNYKPRDGMLHSKFIGLDKFKFLFGDATFIRVIRNTLAMGTINLITSFVMAILFAILLNEVRWVLGKKLVQTISYLPHFLSWIIVTGILHDALSSTGIINEILLKLGIIESQINFLHMKVIFGLLLPFPTYGKKQVGTQLSIWQQSQLLIQVSMKRHPLTAREDGLRLNILHFRVLNLPLSYCF